jgi:hypothetical protein
VRTAIRAIKNAGGDLPSNLLNKLQGGDVEINSDNWYEHITQDRFRFVPFQRTSTNVYGDQDMVIIALVADHAGVQFALTNRSFREFLTAEAKREGFGGEEEA